MATGAAKRRMQPGVAEIGPRLTVLERDFEKLAASVDALARKMEENATETARHLSDTGRKLDQLISRQPKEDRWKEWMGGALTAGALIGMLYAGANYWFGSEFSRASESIKTRIGMLETAKNARLEALQSRVDRIEGAIEWSAKFREPAK